MRFSDQVRWSRKWGAILLLLSGLMFGAIYLLAENGRRDLALYGANICTALLFFDAVLLVFGGLMRPLQKAFYHRVLEGNDRYRRHMALSPMSLFVWLDSEGHDRDA